MKKKCGIHTVLIDDDLQNCSFKSCYNSAYMYMNFCIYFVIHEGLVCGDWPNIHDKVSFYQVRHAELNIEYANNLIEREFRISLSFGFNQQNVCSMIKCIGPNCIYACIITWDVYIFLNPLSSIFHQLILFNLFLFHSIFAFK